MKKYSNLKFEQKTNVGIMPYKGLAFSDQINYEMGEFLDKINYKIDSKVHSVYIDYRKAYYFTNYLIENLT
jgi:hypothetical protein